MSLQNDKTLISKKDLLEKYKISYGALYRWKRKGLIPEDWFIKQATVTGQETFFPEKIVCERIELILSKKEDALLDQIAKELNKSESGENFLVLDTVFGKKTFKMADIKEIFLENTEAKTVTGRIVTIGKGCKIDTVRYSESIEISPDAKVNSQEKLD